MALQKDQIVHEIEKKEEKKLPKKFVNGLLMSVAGITVIVIISILAVSASKSVRAKNVDGAFQGYLALMGNGKYEEAYNKYISASLKKEMDVKAFKDRTEFYLEKLGPFFEKHIEDRQFIELEGKNAVDIFCTSIYPAGPAIEKYLLVKEKGGWKIEGFNIEAPPLARLTDKPKEELREELPPELAADLAARESY